VSFFIEEIFGLLFDFRSCEKPIFIKNKQQNKSMYDGFVCNGLNAIFVKSKNMAQSLKHQI
jgi:hypothetical protein